MLISQEDVARSQHHIAQKELAPYRSLIGAHLVSNDHGEPEALLVFSREGSFYAGQFGDENGFNALLGYGIGTYAQLNNHIHFICEDTNDTSDIQSGLGHNPASSRAPYILKILDSSSTTTRFETTSTPPESFSARRVAKDQGEMAGSWKLNSHDVVIVFNGDDTAGDYFLIEFGISEMETKWTEAGTYTRSGDVIIPIPFMATTSDDDTGEMDGSFIIEISGDTMTFIIEEPDGVEEVTLTRID